LALKLIWAALADDYRIVNSTDFGSQRPLLQEIATTTLSDLTLSLVWNYV
jgi:hypothetical protein